ncbi:PaaI family thioesterase [Nocardioides campestrisoli]|uniref:PaaI family thioesterase n=1 Tax=Nocardioides campestrisoli TaxID=2736757 RepID=UPI00163DC296|nr:PaaI family thioesterase [Nocardioides campestrisoli]
MHGYHHEELTSDELARLEDLYGPFTQSVRELADATVRTTVDEDELRKVQAEIEALTARLRSSQIDGTYGVRFSSDGTTRPWGNAIVGLRNPVAPPLTVRPDPAGRAEADFVLGAGYEGPPGLVHGGISAAILDQLLGEAAGAGGKPGMTGSLTIRYRRPTPLDTPLTASAWIDRTEGWKTYCLGTIHHGDELCVEAEGLFIVPKWARSLVSPDERPPRFD